MITQRVPYPPNKGEKLRTYHQLKYLKEQGHSITVLSPVDSALEIEFATELANKLEISVITKPLTNKLLRLTRGLLTGQALSEANFFSSDLMDEVSVHAAQADVILCSASSLAKYVFELSQKTMPLLLMDFMDVDSDKWLQYARNSSLPMRFIYQREHKLIKELERKIMSRFDRGFIIAQAEYDLFQTSVCQCDNLYILGNGIDQHEFAPNHQSRECMHYLFAGVMDYKPNVDAVLWFVNNCWAEIKTKVPNAHLTIAGMNPETKIKALSKDSSIEITGFVDDILPFFHRADAFIAPFQIARGVQNKVLQAMSCGIAVVATSLGAEGIITEHNKNMIVANTSKEFTDACVLLSRDETMRKVIGDKAHQTITDNYSWPSVLKPLEDAVLATVESNESKN